MRLRAKKLIDVGRVPFATCLGNHRLPSSIDDFRLIRSPDRDAIAEAFEALADAIQKRNRVTALQHAVDEHPEAFEEYAGAMR
jgi:hypothetical protein